METEAIKNFRFHFPCLWMHPSKESFRIAKQQFGSEIHRSTSPATFILGRFAADSKESLEFLTRRETQENDWRVQELPAEAFG